MLNAGATTMEVWQESDKPNLSWSHPWCSAPASAIPLLLMGVAPIDPVTDPVDLSQGLADPAGPVMADRDSATAMGPPPGAGWSRAAVRPQPPPGLAWAAVSVPVPAPAVVGVSAAVASGGQAIELRVNQTIPGVFTAALTIPAAVPGTRVCLPPPPALPFPAHLSSSSSSSSNVGPTSDVDVLVVNSKAVPVDFEGRMLCAKADLLPGSYVIQRTRARARSG